MFKPLDEGHQSDIRDDASKVPDCAALHPGYEFR
jgi:hypothetical protein